MLLLKDSTQTVTNGGTANSIAHFLTVLVIFILVLGVTYFTTHFIAKSQQGRIKSRNLEILETIALAQNKYLQIVRIGERYAALGVGKDEVRLLMELDSAELAQASGGDGGGFAGILQRMKEKFPAGEEAGDMSHGSDTSGQE